MLWNIFSNNYVVIVIYINAIMIFLPLKIFVYKNADTCVRWLDQSCKQDQLSLSHKICIVYVIVEIWDQQSWSWSKKRRRSGGLRQAKWMMRTRNCMHRWKSLSKSYRLLSNVWETVHKILKSRRGFWRKKTR